MEQMITSLTRSVESLISQVLLIGLVAVALFAIADCDGMPLAKAAIGLVLTVVVLILRTMFELTAWLFQTVLRAATLKHPEWQATLDHLFDHSPKASGTKTGGRKPKH